MADSQGWVSEARSNAGMLTVLGVVQIIVGILALGSPLVTGVGIVMLIGIVILVAGILRLFGAFKAGSFGAGVLALSAGWWQSSSVAICCHAQGQAWPHLPGFWRSISSSVASAS